MIELERLRVSLTKNGYMKIAELLKWHAAFELLDHLDGDHPGIKLERSQVANILGADGVGEQVPQFWDDIKAYGDDAVEAFMLLAVILSHYRLIDVLRRSSLGGMRGHLDRNELSEKEFTNLHFAMASLRLCEYERGAEGFSYDFFPLVRTLQDAHSVIRALVKSKLTRCRWRDPDAIPNSGDPPLLEACHEIGLHEVLGMEIERFDAWIMGEHVEMG